MQLPQSGPTLLLSCCATGELNFNIIGVAFQMGSIVSESIRLVLVQILLQASRCGARSCRGWASPRGQQELPAVL
jgi:hypothetical protein